MEDDSVMQISPKGFGELKTSKSDFPYWENHCEMLGKIVVESRPANQ